MSVALVGRSGAAVRAAALAAGLGPPFSDDQPGWERLRCPACRGGFDDPQQIHRPLRLSHDGRIRCTAGGCSEAAVYGALGLPTPTEPEQTLVVPQASGDTAPSLPNSSVGAVASPNGSVGRATAGVRYSRLAPGLGITAGYGERFPCVIPGCGDHEAFVHPAQRGPMYCCEGRSIGFAEVRAALAYGGLRRISDVEAARWRERLRYETGDLMPRPAGLWLPEGCADAVRSTAEGIALLVGLRDPRWGNQAFTYAREFAMAYSPGRLTSDQVRGSIETLERHESILRDPGVSALRGRPIHWLTPAMASARGISVPARRAA